MTLLVCSFTIWKHNVFFSVCPYCLDRPDTSDGLSGIVASLGLRQGRRRRIMALMLFMFLMVWTECEKSSAAVWPRLQRLATQLPSLSVCALTRELPSSTLGGCGSTTQMHCLQSQLGFYKTQPLAIPWSFPGKCRRQSACRGCPPLPLISFKSDMAANKMFLPVYIVSYSEICSSCPLPHFLERYNPELGLLVTFSFSHAANWRCVLRKSPTLN